MSTHTKSEVSISKMEVRAVSLKQPIFKTKIGSQIRIVIRISMKLCKMIVLYGSLMCIFYELNAAIIGRDIDENVEKCPISQ